MATKRTRQTMSEDAKIAAAKRNIAKLGLDANEIMPQLQAKMGSYAYEFVNQALMRPTKIIQRTGEHYMNSKNLIKHYATDEIPPSQLARAVNHSEADVKAHAAAYQPTEQLSQQEIDANNRQEHMETRLGVGDISQKPEIEEKIFNNGPLSPKHIEGSAENKAYLRAQEELNKLKQGQKGEITLSQLKEKGVTQKDMQAILTKDRFSELHTSPMMSKIADKAIEYDKRTNTVGWCARGTKAILRDSIGCQIGQGSGTETISKATKNSQLFCFTYDADMKRNPEIENLPAGTTLGWSGEKKAKQPLGHTTTLGKDGLWHCDVTERMTSMSGAHAPQRYGDRRTGKSTYTIILPTDATISDELAADMLYQKYLREEQSFIKTNFNQVCNNNSGR